MCLLESFVTTGTGSAETNTADTALDPNCDGNAVLGFAEKSSLGLVPVSALGQQYLLGAPDSEDADCTTVLYERNC